MLLLIRIREHPLRLRQVLSHQTDDFTTRFNNQLPIYQGKTNYSPQINFLPIKILHLPMKWRPQISTVTQADN